MRQEGLFMDSRATHFLFRLPFGFVFVGWQSLHSMNVREIGSRFVNQNEIPT